MACMIYRVPRGRAERERDPPRGGKLFSERGRLRMFHVEQYDLGITLEPCMFHVEHAERSEKCSERATYPAPYPTRDPRKMAR